MKKHTRFSFSGFFLNFVLGRRTREIINQMFDASRNLSGMSDQLHELTESLSTSAGEQASAIQETSASADEVNAMISRNAENANRARATSTGSAEAAGRGKTAVADMMRSIEDIHVANAEVIRQIEESNQKIGEIVKVIKDIGSKTKIINDIVFQTKLLSFNASVEAARAGEHGKGFAVVAEEVGNLAQMSGKAAKEISLILDSSISRVQEIVRETSTNVGGLMAESRSKIERGTVTARHCGEVLDEIVTSVVEVNSFVSEIATASKEQSQGVNEINKAVGQLDLLMQTSLAATQSASGLAQRLKDQSAHMARWMNELTGGASGEFQIATQPPFERAPSAKIIPLPSAKKAAGISHAADKNLKLASGASVPSRDDRRFEEV